MTDKTYTDKELEEMADALLAENQLKYQGLISSINQEFTNLQTVMK